MGRDLKEQFITLSIPISYSMEQSAAISSYISLFAKCNIRISRFPKELNLITVLIIYSFKHCKILKQTSYDNSPLYIYINIFLINARNYIISGYFAHIYPFYLTQLAMIQHTDSNTCDILNKRHNKNKNFNLPATEDIHLSIRIIISNLSD
jgi:hypothetical protein